MKRNELGQFLIVLLGSLLMGGSGLTAGLLLTGKTVSEIRKDTLAMVEDTDRRDKIKAVLGRWEKDAKRLDTTRNKNIRRLIAQVQRHDAKPADFDPVFAAFDEIEAQGFDAALAMRFTLREQISAEEWRQLFPSPVQPQSGR